MKLVKKHIKKDNHDVIIAIPDTDISVHEVKNKGNKKKRPLKCETLYKSHNLLYNKGNNFQENNKKLLTCNICGSTFKEEEGLRNHFSEIHQWKKFNCDKCDACFNHFSDMDKREFCVFFPLVLGTLGVGIYPVIFLNAIHASTYNLLEIINPILIY